MPLYPSTTPPLFGPPDHNLAGWSYDPSAAQGGTVLPTAGTLFLSKAKAVSSLITNVIIHVASAGVTLTANQCLAALFSSAGTLLSATADQSAAWTSTGLKTMALLTPQTVPLGYVYVGFYANGTTLPSLSRSGTVSALLANAGLSAPSLRFASADAGLTTAMPGTLGAQTASANTYWVGLS